MFENSADFDFDDEILNTSFTPAFASTQSNVKDVSNNSSTSISKELPTREIYSDVSTVKTVKRKFPGPAGILPARSDSKKSMLNQETRKNETLSQVMRSIQTSNFEHTAWDDAVKDLKLQNGMSLIEFFNIEWIKQQSRNESLVNQKTPFLAAVIQSIDCPDAKLPTTNAVLKDNTGEIQGTILSNLYEEYSKYFTQGSVVILRNCSVLSASQNSHCLNIAPSNLVAIYSFNVIESASENGEEMQEQKSVVEKLTVQDFDKETVLKKYNEGREQKQKLNFKSINTFRKTSSFENSVQNISVPSNNKFLLPKSKTLLHQTDSAEKTAKIPNVQKSSSESQKKFNFKQGSPNYARPYSSECLKSSVQCKSDNVENKEHQEILKNLLSDVDMDSLLGDF